MSEVGCELQVIRMANAEAMEVQKRAFQLELDKMREKLELVESRSETLGGGLRILKALKVTKDEQSPKNTSIANKVLTTNKNKI